MQFVKDQDQKDDQKEEEDSFIDENDHDIPYTELPRKFGDGELRIGDYLNLNEDIYSLGFASLVKNETIDEVLLKDDAKRPKDSFVPMQTPKGTVVQTPRLAGGIQNNFAANNDANEEALY